MSRHFAPIYLSLALTIYLSLALTTGCAGSQSKKHPEQTALTGVQTGTALKAKRTSPCPRANTTYEGQVTLTGTVKRTKGAQLFLNDKQYGGVILNLPRGQAPNRWFEKRVNATGDLCVYTCGPMEQCLMTGEIKYLRNPGLSGIP